MNLDTIDLAVEQVVEQAVELTVSGSGIDWLIVSGLGCLWLGGQIVWVAPLPRQVRRWFGAGDVPTADPGSPAAFGLFWIDQYGWIVLSLCLAGALLVLTGALA